MVLPGWNVTEPLQVAMEFYVFIRKYKAAPEKIKAFALEVEDFSHALRSLDDCLQDPNPALISSYENLKVASVSFKSCAEDCQSFIQKFFKENGRGSKLRWIWKNEEASDLQKRMDKQVTKIMLHINITLLKHRQEHRPLTPQAYLWPDKKVSLNHESITPAPLKNFRVARSQNSPSTEKTQVFPGIRSSSNLHNLDQDLRRSSLPDYFPLEVLQRRGSNNPCYPSQYITMENLDGVSLCSRIEGDERRQIQMIELLKDDAGMTEYVVITLDTQPKTIIFQQLPSLPQPIPHSEHPTAYRNQTVYRIKFLHHLQLPPQRWLPSRRSTAGSSATPSERRLSTPSNYESPYTPQSSYMGSPINLGSPQLPASSVKIVEELPNFEFQHPKDYERFQEIMVGKDLLLNAPVNTIVSKTAKNSEQKDETEKQYLRLWKSGQSQTIMYYANLLPPVGLYKEYDVECFRPVESKPTSSKLVLEVKQSGVPATDSPKKQGSFMSALSSPLSIGKGSKNGKEADGNYYAKALPESLRDLKSLTITFTDTKDKLSFLKQAKFDGIPNSSMLPPLLFEPPSPQQSDISSMD